MLWLWGFTPFENWPPGPNPKLSFGRKVNGAAPSPSRRPMARARKQFLSSLINEENPRQSTQRTIPFRPLFIVWTLRYTCCRFTERWSHLLNFLYLHLLRKIWSDGWKKRPTAKKLRPQRSPSTTRLSNVSSGSAKKNVLSSNRTKSTSFEWESLSVAIGSARPGISRTSYPSWSGKTSLTNTSWIACPQQTAGGISQWPTYIAWGDRGSLCSKSGRADSRSRTRATGNQRQSFYAASPPFTSTKCKSRTWKRGQGFQASQAHPRAKHSTST